MAEQVAPSPEMIASWKETYGKVFVQNIDDILFYFRRLTRPEYRDKVFAAPATAAQREELICRMTTLWPKDFDFGAEDTPAGIATTLSEAILDKSGFAPKSQPQEL